MHLSRVGTKMASLSGLRGIMEDIAATVSAAETDRWCNLGIGNPAAIPEVVEGWRRLTAEALDRRFAEVSCGYGASRGLPALIDAVVRYFNGKYGWDIGPENVAVTPGSQMLCFLAAALFTGPTETGEAKLLLPMTPDYTGYQGLSLSAHSVVGVDPTIRTREEHSFRYGFDFPRVADRSDAGLMLLSSPGNPAGRCASGEEIANLIAVAEAYDVPLLIDNAYGAPFPAIAESVAAPVLHRRVVNCFSVSKAGLPGERLGFAIGDPAYITPIVSFMANSALHAPQLVQATLALALDTGFLDSAVASAIAPFYARRRKYVETLLSASLPDRIRWRLHESDGGMFCWIWIDEDWFDDAAFYRLLKERGVFIVPGRHFFTEPDSTRDSALGAHPRRCFRLSITPAPEVLESGIGVIAETLDAMSAGRL